MATVSVKGLTLSGSISGLVSTAVAGVLRPVATWNRCEDVDEVVGLFNHNRNLLIDDVIISRTQPTQWFS